MIVLPSQQQTPLSLAQAPMSQADADRKRQMGQAWKAYRGEFQKPLKVASDQPDDNVLANRCAPIVDKGVSFLFGQEVKVECVGDNDNDEDDTTYNIDAMQDYLDSTWGDPDDKMTMLTLMAVNGGVCGMNFVKIIPPQGQMRCPRLVVLDPQIIRVITAPEDSSLVLAYVIEYPCGPDQQKRQIITRVDPDSLAGIAGEYDFDDTWSICNYERKGSFGSWSQVGQPEVWPYPFPPIFCNQNLPNPNEVWGVPDLTHDLIEQNKVLNFVESNTSRIIKYHGHPITYAVGLNASEITIGVEDLICLPSPESKLEKLDAIHDLAGLLAFAEVIRSNMDEQSRVPAVALGRLAELPKGNISGVALQLLFQPLIEKTILKQRLYGRCIRAISRAVLVIGGLLSVEDYETYPINLTWQNLLPIDDLAAAQTGLLYKQLGISNTTIQSRLGFNPDEEADKVASETQQQLTSYAQGQGLPPTPQPAQQQQESPFIGGGQ